MSNVRKWTRVAGLLSVLATAAATPAMAQQRISVELETSQLSVANDIAEATFKVVVENEEAVALAGVWLVFEDGFEVSVGEVAPESSSASESTTRTFDLSEQVRSLNVPFRATLKYSADGQAKERAITVVLRLNE